MIENASNPWNGYRDHWRPLSAAELRPSPAGSVRRRATSRSVRRQRDRSRARRPISLSRTLLCYPWAGEILFFSLALTIAGKPSERDGRLLTAKRGNATQAQ